MGKGDRKDELSISAIQRHFVRCVPRADPSQVVIDWNAILREGLRNLPSESIWQRPPWPEESPRFLGGVEGVVVSRLLGNALKTGLVAKGYIFFKGQKMLGKAGPCPARGSEEGQCFQGSGL